MAQFVSSAPLSDETVYIKHDNEVTVSTQVIHNRIASSIVCGCTRSETRRSVRYVDNATVGIEQHSTAGRQILRKEALN